MEAPEIPCHWFVIYNKRGLVLYTSPTGLKAYPLLVKAKAGLTRAIHTERWMKRDDWEIDTYANFLLKEQRTYESVRGDPGPKGSWPLSPQTFAKRG